VLFRSVMSELAPLAAASRLLRAAAAVVPLVPPLATATGVLSESVVVPPKATAPPPLRPVPEFTVTPELASMLFVTPPLGTLSVMFPVDDDAEIPLPAVSEFTTLPGPQRPP
jgi:hypothetical protein